MTLPKPGIDSEKTFGILSPQAKANSWTLCIGAGTSVGIFPSWQELVEVLISEEENEKKADELFEALKSKFGLEALVQSARNLSTKDDKLFVDYLAKNLYSKARKKLNVYEWKLFIKALSNKDAASLTKEEWKKFRQIIELRYEKTSTLDLARSVVESVALDKGPESVISFNGESFFLALLNSFVVPCFKRASKKLQEPTFKGNVPPR